MNVVFQIILAILSVSISKDQANSLNRFSPKLSLNHLFFRSSVVLSGEIERIDSCTAVLREINVYKGDVQYSDSFQIHWDRLYSGRFRSDDRILVFSDTTGQIELIYGIYHPGCFEMQAFSIEIPVDFLPMPIQIPHPRIIPIEWMESLRDGKLIESHFIPITATVHFPLSGETLEVSIVECNDTLCTTSSHSLFDSCQVTSSIDAVGNRRFSFYAGGKDRSIYNRQGIIFYGGYGLEYSSDQLFINYASTHFRTLEEFLDYAATGHERDYNIYIETDYDLSEFGLTGKPYFRKYNGGYPGLSCTDSVSLDVCRNTPSRMDYEQGYASYSLPETDSARSPGILMFKFAEADTFSVGSYSRFLPSVCSDNFLGEILVMLPEDSIPQFLAHFTCRVEEYDDSVSNKDSLALVKDSLCRDLYSAIKPLYLLTEATEPVVVTFNYSESMETDTTLTYAWLTSDDGDRITPSEIAIGVAEEVGSDCSQFTYHFSVPDSFTGRLYLHIRGADLTGAPLVWPYGRDFYGIVDVVDNASASEKELIARE